MFTEVIEGLLELSDDNLDGRIRAIESERRRLDAELAAAISVAEHRQLPTVDGHRTINAYLRATINCSSSEASRLRGLSRAVDRVHGLGDAWFAGHIGQSQATRFSVLHGNRRVRDRLGEFAPLLLEKAEQLPYADFATCVDRFVARADTDGAHDERDDALEHRDAQVRPVGGMIDIAAHGGNGLTAAEMISIHQRFTEEEYRNDVEARRAEFGDAADEHPLPRMANQRRFDAIAAIFRRAATAEGLGSTSDPLVNVVIDVATWSELLSESGLAPASSLAGQPIDPFTGLPQPHELLAELAGADAELSDRRCETSNGVALPPHDVLRAALAGHVRRVVIDGDGVVTDLGRRQRLYTGPAREAAKILIRALRAPRVRPARRVLRRRSRPRMARRRCDRSGKFKSVMRHPQRREDQTEVAIETSHRRPHLHDPPRRHDHAPGRRATPDVPYRRGR